MESVIASLSALLVRALPTFFLLILLHFYLKAMFFGPLEKALRERKAATTGVKKRADEALANAERKAAEYEGALRNARSEIYQEQETMRTAWRAEQAAAVAEMRARTDEAIAQASRRLAGERDEAKASLDAQSEALAEQIAQSVLGGRAA